MRSPWLLDEGDKCTDEQDPSNRAELQPDWEEYAVVKLPARLSTKTSSTNSKKFLLNHLI
jgi:hypothetical protein